ncbi:MAG: T9SS type A sorting domain-containing protein [Chitinophagaceae bacterium]|nr:T9SS type A sorting domain-containing protein [Chitinophagaceae bacterium]
MKPILTSLILLFNTIVLFAQTNISGNISQNTSWTKSGSPYILSGDVIITDKATLTIEPGTIIKFNKDAQIKLRGILKAIGTKTDSIIFTSNQVSPSKSDYIGIKPEINTSVPWREQIHQIEMEYCVFMYAATVFNTKSVFNGPYTFKNCRFGYNTYINTDISQYSHPIYFYNCLFHDNLWCLRGAGEGIYNINDCWFVNNQVGAINVDNVDRCVFIGNTYYGTMHCDTVQNSYFINNGVGALADMHDDTKFSNNELYNNDTGVVIYRMWNRYDIVFKGNKICKNNYLNIVYQWYNEVDISDNCWCSNDSSFIASRIYDKHVDSTLGILKFDYSQKCTTSSPPPATVSVLREERTKLSLYPNPAYETVTIAFDYNPRNSYQINVLDISGKLLFEKANIQTGEISLNTKELQSGLYLVVLLKKQNVLAIEKMIVQ